MELKVFAVGCGDFMSLTSRDLKTGKISTIFIDSAPMDSYPVVRGELVRLAALGLSVDLWIITHNHDDHYGGALAYMRDATAPRIVLNWLYNAPMDVPLPPSIRAVAFAGQLLNVGNMQLTLLTPTNAALNAYKAKQAAKVAARGIDAVAVPLVHTDYTRALSSFNVGVCVSDDSVTNESSITFIVQDGTQRFLMLADQLPKPVIDALKKLGYSSIKPLNVSAMKVSHHGSKHNTNMELLGLVRTSRYVFSANGINQYFFPTKECVARVLRSPLRISGTISLYFNYDSPTMRSMFSSEQVGGIVFRLYDFNTVYPLPGANYVEL